MADLPFAILGTPQQKKQRQAQPAAQGNNVFDGMLSNLFAPAGPQNAVSARMLENVFSTGRDNITPTSGLGQAFETRQLMMAREKEMERQAKKDERAEKQETLTRQIVGQEAPDLLPFLDAGQTDMVWGEIKRRRMPNGGLDPTAAMQEFQFAQSQGYTGTFADWKSSGGSGSGRVSLAGQWGRDEQGNPVYLQPSDTGDMVQARTPEGVTLMSPYELNADRSAGNAYGRNMGGAQFDLPTAQLTAQQTISAIEDVRGQQAGMAEHFGSFLGAPQQWLPVVPKSERANFLVAADRAINRAFLEGREMLKGGGQITDFESRKAEAAITAAQSALEMGDQATFLKALDDFEQAVRDGYAKLERQTSAMPGYGGAQRPQQQNGGQTSSGLKYEVID